MKDIEEAFHDSLQSNIQKSIAKFYHLHGVQNHFEKQKTLYDLFHKMVPNNGYNLAGGSSHTRELLAKMPEDMMDNADFEQEFLSGWQTDIPGLDVIAAERFDQLGGACWYVTYQINALKSVYTVICKYWEERAPQIHLIRNALKQGRIDEYEDVDDDDEQ